MGVGWGRFLSPALYRNPPCWVGLVCVHRQHFVSFNHVQPDRKQATLGSVICLTSWLTHHTNSSDQTGYKERSCRCVYRPIVRGRGLLPSSCLLHVSGDPGLEVGHTFFCG